MMDQSMQTALTRSYFGAQFLGYAFNMAAIPTVWGSEKIPSPLIRNKCAQPLMPGAQWPNRLARGKALQPASVIFLPGQWMR